MNCVIHQIESFRAKLNRIIQMIKDSVLIIGAGGSAHLGYPTAATLMGTLKVWGLGKSVYLEPRNLGLATRSSGMFHYGIYNLWPMENIPCYQEFVKQLSKQSTAKNIDAFLRDNIDHRETGKLLIAAEILSKENVTHASTPSWLSLIIQEFLECSSSEDILSNEMGIISFNYDVSPEYYFYEHLKNTPRVCEYADAFCAQLQENMVHVYGAVRTGTFNEIHSTYGTALGNSRDKDYETTYLLSTADKSEIKVIYGDKQDEVSVMPHIIKAKKLLAGAKRIFVLGFGFDRQNVALLGLKQLSGKLVYYTNQDPRSDFKEIVESSFGSNNNFKAYQKIEDALATIGSDYVDSGFSTPGHLHVV